MSTDVKALAELAKIALSDSELKTIESEFDSILNFVSQVQELELELEPKAGKLKNVLIDDVAEHNFDFDKEALVKAAPKNDGKHILVKKVIKN